MRLEALLKALKVISFSGDPNVEVKAVDFRSMDAGQAVLLGITAGR